MKYIGPDYKDLIILPGFQTAMDPRNWTDDMIQQQIAYNEQIIRYFAEGDNPNIGNASDGMEKIILNLQPLLESKIQFHELTLLILF
jgi:hypothetical protein